jgi:NAD(P)-dependent dehydrogenase (short-subunit alcohol dehydrogenase family)
MARLFAQRGHRVLALSRNTLPLKALQLPNLYYFPFDLGNGQDFGQLRAYLDTWAQVDVLINNAGHLVNKPFLETTPEEFERVYRVNVLGLAEMTRTVLPKMGRDGHVVTISSMGGVQGSVKFPGLSAYSSSKGAVITLTELWAEEFKETGPSFNVLALGSVRTEMLEEAFPGYLASTSALDMAAYIVDFSLTGHKLFNGKIIQVSNSTP